MRELILAAAAALTVSACGGGSSGSAPERGNRLFADAGPDQTVDELSVVMLAGSGGAGSGIVYAWTQVEGPMVSLSSLTEQAVSFTAPAVSAEIRLTFSLTVSDGAGGNVTDRVGVNVLPVNAAPVASAGQDQMVPEATPVVLSGTGSGDSDGIIESYEWVQTGGPPVSLSGSSEAEASFIAPVTSALEMLTFQLTVTDNEGASASATTQVAVTPVNAAPVASATDARAEETVVLDGSTSFDPDGAIVSYYWEELSGEPVILADPSSPVVSFIVPSVPDSEVLVFQLTVIDNEGAASGISLAVSIPPDLVPTAVDDELSVASGGVLQADVREDNGYGPDQAGDLPTTAVLVSEAADGTLELHGDGTFEYAPDASFVGEDVFQYRLMDADGDLSGVATVVIFVAGEVTFTDITSAETGGPPEFGGHGAAFADATGNGLPDLYVTRNFPPAEMSDLFYLNLGGLSFTESAAGRGLGNVDEGSHGAVWADFDADGDLDVFNGSYGQNRLYRNNGTGFFEDVTASAGFPTRSWPTRSVVAFDMDNDGDLDIFAVNGSKGSSDPSAERNEVYRNDGNLQFTAINSGMLFTAKAGQGSTAVDFDNDGDIDIVAANRTGSVNVLINDGGVFSSISPGSIGLTGSAFDGITFADFDNDGFLDAVLNQDLYMSNGDGTFGFARRFEDGAYHYMGGAADLDNDGDFDLVFPGGRHVYLNDGDGNMMATENFSLGTVDDPRSVSFADLDQDGDLDIFYAQKRAFNRLLRNDLESGNRWLKVRLTGASGQSAPYGARVYVFEPGGLGSDPRRITWWELRSQDGYLSQQDPTIHLGVKHHARVDVRVRFLGGEEVDFTGVPTNAYLSVTSP